MWRAPRCGCAASASPTACPIDPTQEEREIGGWIKEMGKVTGVGMLLAVLLVVTISARAYGGDARLLALPDENGGPSVNDVANAGFSSSFYYLHVAGSALRPRASATGWASSVYGGCIYATSGAGEVFNIHLDLPHGSRADYLRIYYYDTNSADSEAWITCYNDIGGFNDRIAVASSGTGGYGTQLSGYLGEVFDYASYSYVLNWRPNVAGTTMWLCGLRVAYRLPTKEVYLPAILKQ